MMFECPRLFPGGGGMSVTFQALALTPSLMIYVIIIKVIMLLLLL